MTTCITCDRPVPGQEYGCPACARSAFRALTAIADLAAAARDVVARQVRRGPAIGGSGAGSRPPLDLGAAERLAEVTNAVTTWARHVAEERGVNGPESHGDGRTGMGESDGLAVAARWLCEHLEWLRHRPEWSEAHGDITAAERTLRAIVDGPPPRRWLGQCGADGPDGPCQQDITAIAGQPTARCRCGATVDVATRLAELAEFACRYSYTAAEIAAAYPGIKAARIRQWAHRGRILPTGHIDGRPTYDLAEVLDLARRHPARGRLDRGGTEGVTSRNGRARSGSLVGGAA
ncbi:MAG TPA: hypothetical protein VF174_05780 [Micromonosporaceae bacterium]